MRPSPAGRSRASPRAAHGSRRARRVRAHGVEPLERMLGGHLRMLRRRAARPSTADTTSRWRRPSGSSKPTPSSSRDAPASADSRLSQKSSAASEPTRHCTVCTIPAPARPRRDAGILEERDVAPGRPVLVGVEEVVDGRVVLVDGLLHEPQAEDARVEVDVPRRIAGDARDVVDAVERHRAQRSRPTVRLPRVKIGIVVPFSWSFWGAVVEHAELQAAALEELGHDVRLVMGNDPPGQFTRVLHPRVGRHGDPPDERDPGGTLGDRAGERLAAEHRALAALVLPDGARARAGALRRAAPARADDADDLPDGAHPRTLPARRDLPRVGRARLDEVRRAGVGVPDRPHRPPHRGLRAREGVAEPLAARGVRGDPERRARPEPRHRPAAASTASSSPAARSRERACRCCCARGPRSTRARGSG